MQASFFIKRGSNSRVHIIFYYVYHEQKFLLEIRRINDFHGTICINIMILKYIGGRQHEWFKNGIKYRS